MTTETIAAIKLTKEALDWLKLSTQAATEARRQVAERIGLAIAFDAREAVEHAKGEARLFPGDAADLPVLDDLAGLLGEGEAGG